MLCSSNNPLTYCRWPQCPTTFQAFSSHNSHFESKLAGVLWHIFEEWAFEEESLLWQHFTPTNLQWRISLDNQSHLWRHLHFSAIHFQITQFIIWLHDNNLYQPSSGPASASLKIPGQTQPHDLRIYCWLIFHCNIEKNVHYQKCCCSNATLSWILSNL